MSVTLVPRTMAEWLKTYHFKSETSPQSILDICDKMTREVGASNNNADKGAIDPLITNINSLYDQYGNEDEDRAGRYYIKEGKHQDFANRYREFEKRYKTLQEQYEKICFYLEKSKNKNTQTDANITEIWQYLSTRMGELSTEKAKFLYLFQQINFSTYNKIYQAAAAVFIFAPLTKINNFLNTKTVESLAITSFIAIAGYSIATNASSSLVLKAISPLFFMYIGHILSKAFKSSNNQLQNQVYQINLPSPLSSPTKN